MPGRRSPSDLPTVPLTSEDGHESPPARPAVRSARSLGGSAVEPHYPSHAPKNRRLLHGRHPLPSRLRRLPYRRPGARLVPREFETSRGGSSSRWCAPGRRRESDRFHESGGPALLRPDQILPRGSRFVAQFGLSADPKGNEPWDSKRIADDSVRQTNTHGTLTFASQGPNTRTHQLYFNLRGQSHNWTAWGSRRSAA